MISTIPVTEQSNEITRSIDKASSREMVEMFSRTDAQLFRFNNAALYETRILNQIEKLASVIREEFAVKQQGKFKVILSGCGTSGRLGYIAARNLNEHLKQDLCEYVIAGEDYALINSVEAVEDSAECGINALKGLVDELDSFLFVGITCGLSAPFVAGQIDYCLRHEKAIAVALIGFNPIELARKNEFRMPDGRVMTFHKLIHENEARENFYVLNPIVGPEPITGSSRMKSGSATKILLDLIFLKFLFKETNLENLVGIYENAIQQVLYHSAESCLKLETLIEKASNALRDGYSINYVSEDMQLGVLGCVDASECLPTFGAERHHIRGFIDYSLYQGAYWNELKKFPETSTEGEFQTILKDTEKNFILLISNPETVRKNAGFCDLKPIFDNFKGFLKNLPENELFKSEIFSNCLSFIIIKLCLNAISTAAHVKQGKTYENYMVDVKASNFKLYKRAIHIVNLLSKDTNDEDTEDCLLKSIYSTNDLTSIDRLNVSEHINVAKQGSLVVPKALIMKITRCDYEHALGELQQCPRVRSCIEKIINKKNNLPFV